MTMILAMFFFKFPNHDWLDQFSFLNFFLGEVYVSPRSCDETHHFGSILWSLFGFLDSMLPIAFLGQRNVKLKGFLLNFDMLL